MRMSPTDRPSQAPPPSPPRLPLLRGSGPKLGRRLWPYALAAALLIPRTSALLAGQGDADAGTDKALDLECYNRVTGGSPIRPVRCCFPRPAR